MAIKNTKAPTRQAGSCCASGNASPIATRNQRTNLPLHQLEVEGSHCNGCVKKIEQALCSVSGVAEASMDLATGIASVIGDVDSKDLIEALDRVGYTANHRP